MRLVLASSSPRRRALLENICIAFSTRVTDVDETLSELMAPENFVCELANRKAMAASIEADECIIGADTIVSLNGVILGKPKDDADAKRMLTALSGSVHSIYTGVAIRTKEKCECFFSKTDVIFYKLSMYDILAYIATGEPSDKAGAYGIQGLGGLFVKEIHGDYFNAVGLPVPELIHRLRESHILP